jgi:NAD(P)-dependent dehydrogenase (short-subunit alcohol dehydrogenase family)
LAHCGASLALNDIDLQALERIVSRVRETGVPVVPLVGDVSDYDRVQQMAAQAIAELGNVFGLVTIAGTSMPNRPRSPRRPLVATQRDVRILEQRLSSGV